MVRAIFFLIFVFSISAKADITNYVTTQSANGKTVVDYSVLNTTNGVNEIIIEYCGSPPNKQGSCVVLQSFNVDINQPRDSFEISTIGIHKISFFTEKRFSLYGSRKKLLWEQFVFNSAVSSAATKSLARQYAPIVSFHLQEKYFPVPIEKIFDRSFPIYTYLIESI